MGSIPGWGTKILHAAGHGPETNKYKIKGNFLIEKKKKKNYDRVCPCFGRTFGCATRPELECQVSLPGKSNK